MILLECVINLKKKEKIMNDYLLLILYTIDK